MMTTLTLSIEGMHCLGGTDEVSNALKALPGTEVENVIIGTACVRFDPQTMSASALIGSLYKLGLKATID